MMSPGKFRASWSDSHREFPNPRRSIVMTVDDPESAATCCHHAAWCPPDPCTNSTAGPVPCTS